MIGVNAGQTGIVAGRQAAQTSMNDTYVNYNGMYYGIPTGAIVMKSNTGAFLGYQTMTGDTVSVTGMTALTQEQYN